MGIPSPSETTQPERADLHGRPAVQHLLVQVLCFDDLLRDEARAFPVLKDAAALHIGRRPPGARAGLLSPDRLLLDDPHVSAQHAVLLERGGAVLLSDQGSRNGTYCNDQALSSGERVLGDGDLIQVGHTLLCYRALPLGLAAVVGVAAPALGPVRTLCPEVARLVLDLQKVAPQPESVLIVGETGVGKDIVAQEVHRLSRRPGALRVVNAGAVPESLFESTFFGHRRGAFTGASEDRDGEILQAQRGTLFIDEVGTLSRGAQAKLLRVLEDGRVTPVGGHRALDVDVRWVSATNRDLLADREDFRPDLLQRLAGYVAQPPPLRRRREDLGILSAYFLRQLGMFSLGITASAARRLYCGAFPGNVRQLRKTLRVAAALAGAGPIEEQHLSAADLSGAGAQRQSGSHRALAAAESPPPVQDSRARLQEALLHTQGNVTRAARLLAVDPKQVYRWVERYALDLAELRKK